MGKRENKKLSSRFVPIRCVIENSKKITKKFKKLKKYHYEFISSQNRLEKDEKDRNKNFRSVPFRSYPTRNIKFQKNRQKIQNIKNYQYGNISGENSLEKDVNEIK